MKLKVDLKRALPIWVENGLLSPEQSGKILDFQTRASRTRKSIPLPLLAMVLASVLIALGLFMFYAANWRAMAPAFKLAQVFLLLIGFYGAGFAVGVRKGASHPLARVLIVLGMVSFGVGISLVAQIFHISAHPTNGLLTWLLAVLVMSAICRETWGLYLGGILLFIWNAWEAGVYGNPNHLMAPILLAYGFLAWREKSALALIAGLGFFLYYLVQAHILLGIHHENAAVAIGSVLLFFFYGLLFIQARALGEKRDFPAAALKVAEILGWILVLLPFALLSWPFPSSGEKPLFLALLDTTAGRGVLVEGVVLATLLVLPWRRSADLRRWNPYFAWILVFALAMFFLPLGSKTVLMVATHLGMLAFFFGMLYFSFGGEDGRRGRRVLAIVFPCFLLFAKFIGFLGLGLDRHGYFVCYLVGFIVFAIVVVLIGQVVKFLLEKKKRGVPEWILTLVATIFIFGSLYALSFEVKNQKSIFSTGPMVLTLFFVLLGIALSLFAWLARLASDKWVTGLAAAIFAASVALMFLARPDLDWKVYSIGFNLLLFLLEGAVIALGARRGSRGLQILGIGFFTIHLVTRYFDLVWDLLSGSALFLATGALILAIGVLLERQRRRLFSAPPVEKP